MHGDIIRNIRKLKDYIGHFHTAGNPGRAELDDTQEINYPAVMRAILETGFDGFVARPTSPNSAEKKKLWKVLHNERHLISAFSRIF